MTKKIKKILAVTGIRSEYDILYPVIDALRKHESFQVQLVVCGAHLSDWHGDTLKDIESDEFDVVDKIDYLLMTNRKTQRAKGIGNLISSLTQTVDRIKPDFILYVGDREESIACSIVANYMNVLAVHIGGGDSVYGNADDPIRFACSELAHIHFATSQQYADNLLKIGEEPKRVIFSGNPALKNIKEVPSISKKEISKKLDFKLNKYAVIIKHPLSSSKEDSYYQMKTTLEAVSEFIKERNIEAVGIFPNTDPGSYDILKAIKEEESNSMKFFKNLPRNIFVNLIRHASLLIGNSSMGILEAPYYKLPVINIGDRQLGRLNAGNVKFLDYDKKTIKSAMEEAIFDSTYIEKIKSIKNPYGDGNAHERIVEFLENLDLKDKNWHIKQKVF